MALAISEPTPEVFSTSQATTYAMAAFTPTAESLLVLFVNATGTQSAGSVTGGSLTWIKVEEKSYAIGVDKCWMFIAQVDASPASTTVTFSCVGDAGTGCGLHIFQVTGHNQFVPIVQTATGENQFDVSPGDISFAVAALNTNNAYIYGVASDVSNPIAAAPPASWTEISDGGYGNPTTGASAAYRINGETGTGITVGLGQGESGGIFIEIAEAAQGTQPESIINTMGFFGV